ncbi:MAG: hypothetical protein AAB573_00520 [Patescibacteria group bacterium]
MSYERKTNANQERGYTVILGKRVRVGSDISIRLGGWSGTRSIVHDIVFMRNGTRKLQLDFPDGKRLWISAHYVQEITVYRY